MSSSYTSSPPKRLRGVQRDCSFYFANLIDVDVSLLRMQKYYLKHNYIEGITQHRPTHNFIFISLHFHHLKNSFK
jgi:hypothetical protein